MSKKNKLDIEKKREKEKQLSELMIRLYCKGVHKTKKGLCVECMDLLGYCNNKTDKCPFMEDKTFCVACRVHCYGKAYREKIREVMKYSGKKIIWRKPVFAIKHLVAVLEMRRKSE